MQTIFQSTFPFTLHTVFKVLESFFTVTLFTVTMETLHSQTLKAHITGQVINSDVEQKMETSKHKGHAIKVGTNADVCLSNCNSGEQPQL